ncbi:MAG TPA: lytic transglycosylase domain-containing protein, partial [Pyrinomonadaceae bacterium]
MHFTPRKPLRSFKNVVFAVIAIFVLSNFIDSPFTRVLAPVSASTVSAANAISVDDYIPSDVPKSGDHELDLVIARTGRSLGVDPRLIHAVIWQESKYKPSAESHAGAQGLMQLMPAAAKRFGCDDRNDAAANVTAGTKYLRWLLKRFDGNVTLALAAYNAGEGNVDKYEGVPPFDETQAYVRIITG